MTRVKLDTPAFADNSVDTRTIKDGTIIAQDVSGSITNAKLANSSITLNGSSVSLGGSASVIVYLDWQAVTVADGSTTLTAEAGKGYFLDTNTGVIEVFLPSSPSRGDTIALVDYSGTFATNQLIINTGGQKIDSSTTGPEFKVTTNNSIVELVYVDANKGWLVNLNQAAGTTPSSVLTDGVYDTDFMSATGGTVTTSGNFKIHTFTGDSNFVVTGDGTVDYLVVAGGGGSGCARGGGGGAGGFRVSNSTCMPSPLTSPLASPTGISVTSQTYPISVGGGGAGGSPGNGSSGSNSVFSTITSAGGGGGRGASNGVGVAGGSGGGGKGSSSGPPPGFAGGAGNTPPVSPSQGNNGGKGGDGVGHFCASGGGGGAGAVGGDATAPGSSNNPGSAGPGGIGSFIIEAGFGGCNGTPGPVSDAKYFSGGGGGAVNTATPGGGTAGGLGGGGRGFSQPGNPAGATPAATAGTANTGGGAGGGGGSSTAGGKGIVILRYQFQ